MREIESEAVRIGVQFGKGLLESLTSFIEIMAKPEYQNKPVRDVSKNVKDACSYTDNSTFIKEMVSKGKTEFETIGLEKQQMSKFDQLASQYNLKYLYERAPNNLDDLLHKDRSNISQEEKEVLQKWCKEIDGKYVSCDDDAKITFAVKDIPKIEAICNDLKKHIELEKRITIAKAKNKVKTKEKTKKKEKTIKPKER